MLEIEVIKRNRVIEGDKITLWEIRLDGKTLEVVDYDPTELVELMKENFVEMCEKWHKHKKL